MKKILFPLVALMAFLVACELVPVTVPLSFNNIEFTINETEEIGTFRFDSEEVVPNLAAEIEPYRLSEENVTSVLGRTLTFTIVNPDMDFSFLESAEAFIVADGLLEVKIGWVDAVPDNSTQLILVMDDTVQLLEYLKADSFRLIAEATTIAAIEEDLIIQAELELKVEGTL